MNKNIIIIQARLSSTRLPRKILSKIPHTGGLSLIEFMYRRISDNIKIPVFFAIPISESDDELASFLRERNINFYRGPEDDLIGRYIIGAEMYSADTIIRLTSDCPLVDPFLINNMLSVFDINQFDYLCNTTPPQKSSFPDGSDIEIFSTNALRKANYQETDPRNREHVTFQFWDHNSEYLSETYQQEKSFSHLRYTIDNPEDVIVFNEIYKNLISISYEFVGFEEIQNFLEENKEVAKINEHYKPGDNW